MARSRRRPGYHSPALDATSEQSRPRTQYSRTLLSTFRLCSARDRPTGVAIATQNVARPNAARERQSEVCLRRSGIGKNVDAARLLEHTRFRLGRHLCYRGEEPVGRPALASIYAEGETAGPARQPRELPAPDESIEKTTGIACQGLASAERQIGNPINVELMCEVVIGDGAG